MKKRSIISVVVVAVSLSLLYGNISYAGRQWNRFHRSSRDVKLKFPQSVLIHEGNRKKRNGKIF